MMAQDMVASVHDMESHSPQHMQLHLHVLREIRIGYIPCG